MYYCRFVNLRAIVNLRALGWPWEVSRGSYIEYLTLNCEFLNEAGINMNTIPVLDILKKTSDIHGIDDGPWPLYWFESRELLFEALHLYPDLIKNTVGRSLPLRIWDQKDFPLSDSIESTVIHNNPPIAPHSFMTGRILGREGREAPG